MAGRIRSRGGLGATDRRGFLRWLGGTVAFLSGVARSTRANSPARRVHRATRNTKIGPSGPRPSGRFDPPVKPYPGLPRSALPRVEPRTGPPLASVAADVTPAAGFALAALPLPSLTRLLHLANGVTGSDGWLGAVKLRAAPSAGALYAPEIYVVATRVEALRAGVYYYDPLAHELVAVRRGAFGERVAEALEHPGAVAQAPAFVLITSVFARYTHQYANRGYRYALIDVGHIGENLRLAATATGLAQRAPLRFHDAALEALLEVDGRGEALCAIHALGAAAEAAVPSPRVRSLGESQRVAPDSLPPGGSVIERYHGATKLVPTSEAEGITPAAGSGQPDQRPPAEGSTTDVETAIRARRSAAGFCREPISRAQLDFVLSLARGAGVAPVELLCVVHRVTGLDPGLYRVNAESGQLRLEHRGDFAEPLVQACLGQDKAGSASVALVMAGRIEAAIAERGERGYRDLLLASGAIGQRIYLAAEALGLAARNLAAFEDDPFNALLRLDGKREAALHLTVVGVED